MFSPSCAAAPAVPTAGGFRPAWLFGIAAVLLACAALLWVVMDGRGSSGGGPATDGPAGATRVSEGRDAAGPWGEPWGGGAGPADARGAPIAVDALPWKGADDPILAVVEFGDYECSFTRKAEDVVARVIERFAGDVRLVYVHNPLPIHDNAVLAAEAAEAARMQGKFGEMHSRLLAARGRVDRAESVRMAKELGLDVARFERDLDGAAKDAVGRMVAFADARKLDATPHFVVGDRVVAGARSEAEFVAAIEAALAEARERVRAGKSRADVYRDSLGPLAASDAVSR